jgi:hypothetical protein
MIAIICQIIVWLILCAATVWSCVATYAFLMLSGFCGGVTKEIWVTIALAVLFAAGAFFLSPFDVSIKVSP